jgi:hypothetical protein
LNPLDTGRARSAETEPRLPRRDRFILAGVTLLALVAAAFAFLAVVSATLTFFGEQPTPREQAVGAQSSWVLLWALATPFCCWSLLRRGRKAVVGITLWLILLVLCRVWWWPSPPGDDFEKQIQPIWRGLIPWALVAACLVVGLTAAWRTLALKVRATAAASVIAILALSGVAYGHLQQRARDEEPTPLAEGRRELAVLRQDPIWDALPASSTTRIREHPAELSDWGEKFTTWRSVTLGTSLDMALFQRAVVSAESSGWILHGSFCGDGSADGTFTKTLPAGPAYIRISVASYSQGVNVFAELAPAPGPPHPRRCWRG